jgi:phytoene synthase
VIEDLVRTHDRDRYLASLFAPDATRPHLFALYAFNVEIARIAALVSEPQLGLIRQQWWLDTLAAIYEGQGAADHPVAASLAATITAHRLPRAALESLITARTFDLYDDPMPDVAALETYLGHTQSALMQLGAVILCGAEAARAAEVSGLAGVAYGAALLFAGRAPVRYLPQPWVQEGGEAAARLQLASHARQRLSEARAKLKALLPQALPAVLPASLTILDIAGGASQFRRQLTMWWAARNNRF